MLNLNENTNLFGNISTKINEVDTPIININANLNKEGSTFNMSFNIINKELLASNKIEIQNQVDSFVEHLKSKMLDMGYDITI